MKQLLFSVMTFALFTAACNNNESTNSSTADTTTTTRAADTTAPVADNSMNSLDWQGTYKGVVPCADCEGIETIITLGSDLSYTLTLNYKGKKDAKPFEKKGSFTWNTAGTTITLGGITDGATQYIVGENKLIQLDLQGNRITGENAGKYELVKQ